MRRPGMMRTMIIDIDWGKQYLYYKIAKGTTDLGDGWNSKIVNLCMAYYRQWRYVKICFIKENMWLGFRERRHWVQQLCLPLWKGHRRPVGLLLLKLSLLLKKRRKHTTLHHKWVTNFCQHEVIWVTDAYYKSISKLALIFIIWIWIVSLLLVSTQDIYSKPTRNFALAYFMKENKCFPRGFNLQVFHIFYRNL